MYSHLCLIFSLHPTSVFTFVRSFLMFIHTAHLYSTTTNASSFWYSFVRYFFYVEFFSCHILVAISVLSFYYIVVQNYFLPFLNICVPFIPKILATTKIHRLVNHVGRDWKCSKNKFIFSIAAASSENTP